MKSMEEESIKDLKPQKTQCINIYWSDSVTSDDCMILPGFVDWCDTIHRTFLPFLIWVFLYVLDVYFYWSPRMLDISFACRASSWRSASPFFLQYSLIICRISSCKPFINIPLILSSEYTMPNLCSLVHRFFSYHGGDSRWHLVYIYIS